MMAVRKRKPVEAGDGSYGGLVLEAWDRMSAPEREQVLADRFSVNFEKDRLARLAADAVRLSLTAEEALALEQGELQGHIDGDRVIIMRPRR